MREELRRILAYWKWLWGRKWWRGSKRTCYMWNLFN